MFDYIEMYYNRTRRASLRVDEQGKAARVFEGVVLTGRLRLANGSANNPLRRLPRFAVLKNVLTIRGW